MHRAAGFALIVVLAPTASIAACDSCGKPDGARPAALASEAAPGTALPDETDLASALDGSPGDLGKRFRDAGPKIDAGAGDAEAAFDPACTGASLSLGAILADPRCAIGSSKAKQLRAEIEVDGGAAPLRQEAKIEAGPSETAEAGAIRVTVRLINAGKVNLTLPLSHHAKLPAFTALAEDAHRAIFELDAPKLEGVADSVKPRFAVLGLPPGGVAVATVTVETGIVRRIAPACEAGSCGPPKLPKGKYTLYIGQLVADVEAGAPARVEIEVR